MTHDMKHFIELSTRVINTFHIIEIVKKPKKYFIHMNNNIVNKPVSYSDSSIITEPYVIKICKKSNKEDYDTISNVILNHKIYF